MNSYKGNNNFLCNTNQKKKLHPSCARNQINKEERLSKIKKFYRLFNEQVKQGSNFVNRKNKNKFSEYQERYVNFVRETRKDPDLRWIYEHFNYDINRNSLIINPYYVNENLDIDEGLKRQKTIRQKIYIKALKSRELEKIEYELKNEGRNRNSRNILRQIDDLFDSIEINQKINFNFNFDDFIEKCIRMKEFMTNKDLFINERIKNDIIQGEKDFDTIFPNEIFNFLISNGIIDFSLIFEYKLQYTHRFRKLARLRLEELYTFYEHKINWIFDLLSSDFIDNRDPILLKNSIIDNIIKPYIKKYLFYINYTLNNLFDQKELFFEIAYEDFYYYNLHFSLHFIKNFLECVNKNDLINKKEYGFSGNIFEKNNSIIKKFREPVLEKQFFEFFKHLCICYEFNKNEKLRNKIPIIYEFLLGKTDVYLQMEKIDGLNLLQYVFNNIEEVLIKNNQDLNTFKKHFFINIFHKVGELVKNFHEIMFTHQDLNSKNIMIIIEEKSINLKLIDFEFSIIKTNDLFIFNYLKYLDINHIFEKKYNRIIYTDFIKSNDLIRFTINYFNLPLAFKDLLFSNHENKPIELLNEHFNLPPILIQKMRKELYGTDNPIIPSNILTNAEYNYYFEERTYSRDPYLKEEFKKVKSLLKLFKIVSFTEFFLVRKFVYEIFTRMINPTWKRGNWVKRYEFWINPYLPDKFIETIQNISRSMNGGKKLNKKIIKK